MNLDELKKLNEYHSEVDPNDIWQAIEPEVDALNERRKKRRFFFFFLLTGLLIMSGGAFYFFNGTSTSDQHVISKQYQEEAADGNEEKPAPSTDSSQSTDSKETGVQESAASSSNHTRKKTYSKNDRSFDHTPAPAVLTPEMAKLPVTKKPIAVNNSPASTELTNDINNQPIDTNADNHELLKLVENAENKTITSSDLKQQLLYQVMQLPTLLFKTQGKSNIDKFRLPEDFSPLTIPSQTPETPERAGNPNDKLTFGLGLNAGLGYVKRNIDVKSTTPMATQLLNLRQATEKTLEAQQFGLQLFVRHKSGLTLSSGFNQVLITERFDFKNTTQNIQMVPGITHRITDINGIVHEIEGEIPLTQTTAVTKKIYNKFRIQEIPVLVGFNRTKGKWDFGIKAGILANLSVKTSGQILEDALSIINIEERQDQIFKSNIGIGYMAGISIHRQLRPNLQVGFSSYYKNYAADFTVPGYSLSEKYQIFGGSIGLKYSINK